MISENFEKCINYQKWLANCTYQITEYKWSDEFIIKSINDWKDRIKNETSKIDPSLLTSEETELLNFGEWDGNLKLIPGWMYPFLTDNFAYPIYCIDGSFTHSKGDIDDDIRMGYLAYGIGEPLKDTEDDNTI